MTAVADVPGTIAQLNQARRLCLADPNNLYPQIVPGLSPVINAKAHLELRRWGTDFLAEAFASPVLAAEHKQKLSITLLDNIKEYLDKPDEDAMVVRSVVQIASSIYQFVFRYIISNPGDAEVWQKMAAIKSNILRRMDSAPANVRLCCIKFVQRVVQVQTPGQIADPRRQDQNEISLALVPRDHPLIPPSNLEAEASGLLDRLLDVLQDNSSDALLVTATLNSLSSLVRGRASISNKIISTVLAFNPFTLARAQHPISIKNKLLIRSMTRTTMSFLGNILKRSPQHALAGRIHGTLDRLRTSLIDVFDETKRKRPATDEPTDGLSDAKRQRLGVEIAQRPASQHGIPFPPADGPVTYAQLYTLTDDHGARGFDVKAIPLDMVAKIVPALIHSIDRGKLDTALNTVRARFLKLHEVKPRDATAAARTAVGDTGDEDDDYEPDYVVENREQILNELDQFATDRPAQLAAPEVSLGPFNLPPPPPLTDENAVDLSRNTVTRAFTVLSAFDVNTQQKSMPVGFHKPHATNHDRLAWVTTLTRLATRASLGLGYDDPDAGGALQRRRFSAPGAIRDALYLYIIDDFRRRIDVAIQWLNEEWYNDAIASEQGSATSTNGTSKKSRPGGHYRQWLYKILDGFLPFLDAKDRLLIRFLSEVPELDDSVVKRVVRLAADPDRVNLAVQALYYLILYRPPIRQACLDGMEDLFVNYEDAKKAAEKVLVKYRPEVVERNREVKMEGVESTAVKVEA